MHTATLRKIGGSVGLSLPAPIVRALNFRLGERVDVSARDGEIILKVHVPEPTAGRRRSQHTLEEMLAKCEPGPFTADREWLDAPTVGLERV